MSTPWSASTCANSMRPARACPSRRRGNCASRSLAHLDEALPPGATTEAEVLDELGRLGSPALARRRRGRPGPAPAPAAAAQPARPRPLVGVGRARGTHPRARHGGGLPHLDEQRRAADRQRGIGWLYPADQARAVRTTAGDEHGRPRSLPARSAPGHPVQSVVNDSDWTQVIVGADPRWSFVTFSDVRVRLRADRTSTGRRPITGTRSYVVSRRHTRRTRSACCRCSGHRRMPRQRRRDTSSTDIHAPGPRRRWSPGPRT